MTGGVKFRCTDCDHVLPFEAHPTALDTRTGEIRAKDPAEVFPDDGKIPTDTTTCPECGGQLEWFEPGDEQ